jgi:predicted secreted protein
LALIRAVERFESSQILAAKSIESSALTLKSVDDVHGGDGLAFGVLGVSDGIPDDVLKEDFQNSTRLFVDQSRNALDTSTAGKTSYGRLGNSLDIVAKNLAMSLGSALAESFPSFASSGHLGYFR